MSRRAADVEAELERIGHELEPLDIVVVNTSAGAKYGRPDYVASGCGMGAEATLYLLRRGVRVTGTDGWSWDAPFVHTAKRYAETNDASLIWEGHKAGRHIGYCHIEKLHNLEALPSTGFMVVLFPDEDRTRLSRVDAGGRDHRRGNAEPRDRRGCVNRRRKMSGSHRSRRSATRRDWRPF